MLSIPLSGIADLELIGSGTVSCGSGLGNNWTATLSGGVLIINWYQRQDSAWSFIRYGGVSASWGEDLVLYIEPGETITAKVEARASSWWGICTEGQLIVSVPAQTLHAFTETVTNDTGEPLFFETAKFIDGEQVGDSVEVYLLPGETYDFEFQDDEPFEVGVREVRREDNGWYSNEWAFAPSVDAGYGDHLTFDGTLTKNPLIDGNRPQFDFDPNSGETEQILDALEATTANTNERFDAMIELLAYYASRSSEGQAAILEAINSRGSQLLAFVEDLQIEFRNDFEAIQATQELINLAILDLDGALSLIGDQLDDKIGLVLDAAGVLIEKADANKDAIDAVKDAIDDLANQDEDAILALAQSLDATANSVNQQAEATTDLAEAITNLDTTGEYDQNSNEQLQDINANTNATENNTRNSAESLARIDQNTDGLESEAQESNDHLAQIDNNTGRTADGVEELRDIEKARDEEGGVFDKLSKFLDGETPEELDGLAQGEIGNAEAAGQSMETAARAVVGTGSGEFRSGVSANRDVFPVATLPLLGTISFDPFQWLPWLEQYASWARVLIAWAASAVFLFYFYKFLLESMQSTLNTPVQTTSGGGATGLVAVAKQTLISAAVVAFLGTAIIAYITALRDPVVPLVGTLVTGGGINVSSGAPSAVLDGLRLIDVFVPMDHLLSLFAGQLLYRVLAIPLCTGIQTALRVMTI